MLCAFTSMIKSSAPQKLRPPAPSGLAAPLFVTRRGAPLEAARHGSEIAQPAHPPRLQTGRRPVRRYQHGRPSQRNRSEGGFARRAQIAGAEALAPPNASSRGARPAFKLHIGCNKSKWRKAVGRRPVWVRSTYACKCDGPSAQLARVFPIRRRRLARSTVYDDRPLAQRCV